MALMKCPECGKEVSDKSKVCIHCGYKIKRKGRKEKKEKPQISKRKLLIGLSLFIAVAIFLWLFIASVFSIKNVCKMIATGSFECLIRHEWQEATCQHGMLCSDCGSEKGEVVDHNWLDATCVEAERCVMCGLIRGEKIEHDWMNATCIAAQTCSLCKKTEGEPLKHSTQQGYCNSCNEYISELQEKFDFLMKKNQEIIDLLEEEARYVQYASVGTSSAGSYIYEALKINRTIENKINYMVATCQNYPEFKETKKELNNAKRVLPVYSGVNWVKNSEAYWYVEVMCDDGIKFSNYMVKVITELQKLEK